MDDFFPSPIQRAWNHLLDLRDIIYFFLCSRVCLHAFGVFLLECLCLCICVCACISSSISDGSCACVAIVHACMHACLWRYVIEGGTQNLTQGLMQVAAALQDGGIQAGFYHADVEFGGVMGRMDVYNQWIAGKLQVVVATIAFGMVSLLNLSDA